MYDIPSGAHTSAPAKELAVNLLGGAAVFPTLPTTALDVHNLLATGLPESALIALVDGLQFLSWADIASVLEITKKKPVAVGTNGLLTAPQGERLWRIAEVLVVATRVFGSQEGAERWLVQPVMALNYHRPLDLLVTDTGTACLEEYLSRANFNVYM